jgi:hypothetical protein
MRDRVKLLDVTKMTVGLCSDEFPRKFAGFLKPSLRRATLYNQIGALGVS